MLLARVIMGSFVEESTLELSLEGLHKTSRRETRKGRSRGYYRETLTKQSESRCRGKNNKEISENRGRKLSWLKMGIF